MRKQDKAKRIGQILDDLYPAPPIPLQHNDPFTLLVAVVLSAQTTDVQVNKVTPELFARAATAAKLAAMSERDILHIIRSCGLAPGKARNIRKLAQTIADEYGGKVPKDIEALEKLPGVGHKTASVVMSQAFGEPAFAVDTHIHRLAERWGLSSGKNVEQTEHHLKKLFPRDDWAKRHLQMIYFGREYCPARGHEYATCPICSWAAKRRNAGVPPAGPPASRRRLKA
jgi:endonuclease-3